MFNNCLNDVYYGLKDINEKETIYKIDQNNINKNYEYEYLYGNVLIKNNI